MVSHKKTTTMTEEPTPDVSVPQIVAIDEPKHKKPKLKQVADFVRQADKKLKMLLVVALVAMTGSLLLLLTHADPIFEASTNPNDVIVQYSLPHIMMPVSSTNLSAPMTAPFTLYGNGLLVCGHDMSMQFMTGMSMSMPAIDASDYVAPTSVTLSSAQISTLLQQINNTGFFKLNKEYYNTPLDTQQYMLRVSLTSGDHYVLYYNDVPAPEAYTKTLGVLESYCTKATSPYVSSTVTVRTLKDADPKGRIVQDLNNLNSTVKSTVQGALTQADTSFDKFQQTGEVPDAPTTSSVTSSTVNTAVNTPGSAVTTTRGSAAQSLVKQNAKSTHQFVKNKGITYELAVDPQTPTIRNPLQVNYQAIRAQAANKGVGAKLRNFFGGSKVYAAAAQKPIRVVLLLPSSGGSSNNLSTGDSVAKSVRTWYCGIVGKCYSYAGATTIRDTKAGHTASWYTTCHVSGGCGGTPLSSIYMNLAYGSDPAVNNPNYDNVVVAGWNTHELDHGACGVGGVAVGLAILDYYEPLVGVNGVTYGCTGRGANTAHEMGHNFGLNHTGNGTLMDGPPYAKYAANCDIPARKGFPKCKLDSGQTAFLKKDTTYFIPPTPVTPPPVAPTTATLDGAKISNYNPGNAVYGGEYSGLSFAGAKVTVSGNGHTDSSTADPFYFTGGSGHNAVLPATKAGNVYTVSIAPSAVSGYTVSGSTLEDGTVSGWNPLTSNFQTGTTRSITVVAGHAYHIRWIYVPTTTIDGVKIDSSGTGTYGGNYVNLPFTNASVRITCPAYSYDQSSTANPFLFIGSLAATGGSTPASTSCTISTTPSSFTGYTLTGSSWEDGTVAGWNPLTSNFVSGASRTVTIVQGHVYHMRWIYK